MNVPIMEDNSEVIITGYKDGEIYILWTYN